MGFIHKNLLLGEEIKYEARKHWWVFVWPTVFLLFSVGLFSKGGLGYTIGGVVFIILALKSGFGNIIYYLTTEFGVTNKRLLIKTGLVRRDSLELMLDKIEHLSVEQPLFGRVLGYGFLQVSGAGNDHRYPFISHPFEFRKKIQEQIERGKSYEL